VADYRRDVRDRCAKCGVVVAEESQFMNTEGELLCPACRLHSADEELQASLGNTGNKRRPGFRLVCANCRAATMTTQESEMSLRGTCLRCGETTYRFRGLAALAIAVYFMFAVFFDGPAGVPLFTSFGAIALFAGLFVHLRGRARFPVATYEQIEAAERALKAERALPHEDRVRIASEPLVDDAAREAAAEAEAEPEQKESAKRGVRT
jgi:hypothetical protein